jgi:hypothetical protein
VVPVRAKSALLNRRSGLASPRGEHPLALGFCPMGAPSFRLQIFRDVLNAVPDAGVDPPFRRVDSVQDREAILAEVSQNNRSERFYDAKNFSQ